MSADWDITEEQERKSQLETIYDEYLKRDDITVHIYNIVFYRIITKDFLLVSGGMVLARVPKKLLQGVALNKTKVIDEKGMTFELGDPLHFIIRGIPNWYRETIELPIIGATSPEQIGDYLAIKTE